MSSEKYCFSSPAESLLAQNKIKAILVPSDSATPDGQCMVIQMRPHRRELIQRFIKNELPETRITFSSVDILREPCKLQVEKEKLSHLDKLNVTMSNSSLSQQNTTGSGTEKMHIQTLKDFELAVNQNQIKGSCRFLNSDRYEITIEVRKNPKPIVPVGLPSGTIVVLNQPPPDQETMVLQTQLQLSRGQRIELGGVVKELKNKDTQVDIKPSLNIETQNHNNSERVYLSLQ